MSRYDWMGDALCATVNPDLFHQDHGANYSRAKRICNACPVRLQCEAHTDRLDTEPDAYSRHGLWSARTIRERNSSGGSHRPVYSREDIIRLAERGVEAQDIADLIGCHVRTVWRVTKAHREQMEQAA